jgi:hypothetical protein
VTKRKTSPKPKFVDMVGMKFGRWTVLRHVGSDKNGNAMFDCLCSCSNVRQVRGCHLRSGKSTSCGCAQDRSVGARERGVASARAKSLTEHQEFGREMGAKNVATARGIYAPDMVGIGLHFRWHVLRGITNPKCHFCAEGIEQRQRQPAT